MKDSLLLDAALAYAALGWKVVAMHTPLAQGRCSCSKANCRNVGKHPRFHAELLPSGAASATDDPDTIRRWWSLWPDANVGIEMGRSGLVALDEDPRHGGDLGQLPLTPDQMATLTNLSGGGGRHLIFVMPAGMVAGNSNAKLPPGIDVRGKGGVITAPPSLHVSGKRYAWALGLGPEDGVLQPIPDAVLKLLKVNRPGQQPSAPNAADAQPQTDGPIPNGSRHTTLVSLAGSMRRRGMSAEAILAALNAENQQRCQPPLDDDEVRSIAVGVGKYAPKKADYRLTEFGNAQRLIDRHGQDLRFCPAWNRWLVWDGCRFRSDETHEAQRRAQEIIRDLYAEALAVEDDDLRKRLIKWALRSETNGTLQATLALARCDASVVVTPSELDTDPWLLNCLNGTLDLRTGRLRPPQRTDGMTRLVPVIYDPDAQAPTWQTFLARIFPGDPDIRSFIQRCVGYSLTGITTERVIFILWGGGANGKTTFLEAIFHLLGEYALRTPTETFMVRRAGSVPNDIARLQGARFVVASESEADSKLGQSMVKQMTGGDTITARFMRAEWFDFHPLFKLWLATNHRPQVDGSDQAIWDRIRLIPFAVRIPEGERDKALQSKLRAEASGILAWAVQGCLAWQRDGLQTPDAILRATQDYRDEMDPVGDFLTEWCEVHPNLRTSVKDLYEGFKDWCAINNDPPLNKRQLSIELKQRGIEAAKSGSVRYWKGLGLAPIQRSVSVGTERDTTTKTAQYDSPAGGLQAAPSRPVPPPQVEDVNIEDAPSGTGRDSTSSGFPPDGWGEPPVEDVSPSVPGSWASDRPANGWGV